MKKAMAMLCYKIPRLFGEPIYLQEGVDFEILRVYQDLMFFLLKPQGFSFSDLEILTN